VVKGLEILMANQGEVWAKLDAGTESFYREICRSQVPFERILDNLLARPPMADSHPDALSRVERAGARRSRVGSLLRTTGTHLAQGGQLQAIQPILVARPTPEPRPSLCGGLCWMPSREPAGPPSGAAGGGLLGPEEWA